MLHGSLIEGMRLILVYDAVFTLFHSLRLSSVHSLLPQVCNLQRWDASNACQRPACDCDVAGVSQRVWIVGFGRLLRRASQSAVAAIPLLLLLCVRHRICKVGAEESVEMSGAD